MPVAESFSLSKGGATFLESHEQYLGKICPIDDHGRKAIMRFLTESKNIYSLGRYATWRNIGMDDILNDIYQIRKMISADGYDRALKTKT